jgi:hypothetical protein
LPRWLNDRDAKKKIQDSFMKVFTSPKHYPYPGKKDETFSSSAMWAKEQDAKNESQSPIYPRGGKAKDAFLKASQPINP